MSVVLKVEGGESGIRPRMSYKLQGLLLEEWLRNFFPLTSILGCDSFQGILLKHVLKFSSEPKNVAAFLQLNLQAAPVSGAKASQDRQLLVLWPALSVLQALLAITLFFTSPRSLLRR